MNDSKNMHSASGIGVVTLFVVLLILCLTVFAVLTFASANADLRLSQKNSEMVEAYYAADNTATRISAEVSAFWKSGAPKPGARAIAALEEKIAAYEGAEVTYATVYEDEGIVYVGDDRPADAGDGLILLADAEDDTGDASGPAPRGGPEDNGGLFVAYGVYVDTLLTLEVTLSLPRGGVCEVVSWRVMADEPSFEEDTLPVWEG
jgi:hypothetical protein